MSLRQQMRYLNPYDIHKLLINEYVLKRPEDATKIFKRDISKDRTDYDVLRDNHKFLWDEKDSTDTWERQFAKKYYDKLFKEYCIADLTLYKENKIALRWRIEQEVVVGKGQFICGNKRCTQKENLRSWEVNFGYTENGEKKNALVKIRLCPDCSKKLNYHSKKREVKRQQRKKNKFKKRKGDKRDSKEPSTSKSQEIETSESEAEEQLTEKTAENSSSNIWEDQKPIETKSREEEMEDYLQELLL